MISRGFLTLFYKEVLRFFKVAAQTIAAPVLTSVLYMLVFGQALDNRVTVYDGVSYISFLFPGLVMMVLLQNSFTNAASSLIQSKINGSLLFLLLSPISEWETFWAYTFAAMARGLTVALGVVITTVWFIDLKIYNFLWILAFAFLASGVLGVLGLIAGIWAEKYDQLAVFQNFLIMPATFLSGVFYSVKALPHFWQKISCVNPFFYMVDGFRYGFFGQSDTSPWFSLGMVVFFFVLLMILAMYLLKSGYKLRN